MPARREQSGAPPGRSRRVAPPLSELLEHAPDMVIVTDRNGLVIAANRAARRFTGYTARHVRRGVSLGDILSPADYQAALHFTERAFNGEALPDDVEQDVTLRDGKRHRMRLRAHVLCRWGRPYALQTLARDLAEPEDETAVFLASLVLTSEALLTARTLTDLTRVICEETQRVLHVDGAYLWLRQGEQLVGQAAVGRGSERFVGWSVPVAGSWVGELYASPAIAIINDFASSSLAGEEASAFAVQSLLAIPLRGNDAPLGLLACTDCTDPARFDDAQRERALVLGAQIAVAVESGLARERETEEGQVSRALLSVARAIRESREEADLLREITHSARDVIGCDWALVSLWDAAKEVAHVAAVAGWSAQAEEEVKLVDFRRADFAEIERALTHETLEVREPTPAHADLFRRWQASSYLSVPMVRGNALIGALLVGYRERRGPFSSRERRVAEGIAAQAAVAVENARLIHDLRRANDLKSEFLSTMSHELRTPLGAILGYAELMRDAALGPLDHEQEWALDRLLLNGRSLLELINMTLDLNRLESGRITLKPSEFSLGELTVELEEEFAMQANARGVSLVWPGINGMPPVRTDRAKLKLVVRNLVDNALKFTPAGTVTVGVRVDPEREHCLISVRDTGIGIAAGDIPAIFEMFRQLDGTRPAARGVGLGLYLVRRYTELLGGTVTVDSAPGRGSTFTIDFPRALG